MHVLDVSARTPQELIEQLDVYGMVAEPNAKVGRREVCPIDDSERTAIQRHVRSDSGHISESVAVSRPDVAAERVHLVEARVQCRERLGVNALLGYLVARFSEVRTAYAPEVARLETFRDVSEVILGRQAGTEVQPGNVPLTPLCSAAAPRSGAGA